jgi:hypothetical protein
MAAWLLPDADVDDLWTPPMRKKIASRRKRPGFSAEPPSIYRIYDL